MGTLDNVAECVTEPVIRGLDDLEKEGEGVEERLKVLRGVNELVAVSEEVLVCCIELVIVYESRSTVGDALGCLDELAETVEVLLELREEVKVVVPELDFDERELALDVLEFLKEVVNVVEALEVLVCAIDFVGVEEPVLVLEEVDVVVEDGEAKIVLVLSAVRVFVALEEVDLEGLVDIVCDPLEEDVFEPAVVLVFVGLELGVLLCRGELLKVIVVLGDTDLAEEALAVLEVKPDTVDWGL